MHIFRIDRSSFSSEKLNEQWHTSLDSPRDDDDQSFFLFLPVIFFIPADVRSSPPRRRRNSQDEGT